METIMRCRTLLITPTVSCFSRRIFYKAGLNFTRWERPRNSELERNLVWARYCCLKIAEVNIKRQLLDELIQECQIGKKNCIEKILTLQVNISTLIKKNLISSCESVIDRLLSQLEPFPFDRSQILEKIEDENDLSIRHIRNEIERQYLAWKYKVDVMCVKDILNSYASILYDYRSLRNMQRNVEILEKWPGVENLSVADKIYYINQVPFSLKHIKKYQEMTLMLEMKIFTTESPKLLYHSNHFILIFSTLLNTNFKLEQIKKALPFLNLSFSCFFMKLNFLLTTPEIVKYRDKDKFLTLLNCSTKVLREQLLLPKTTFETLVNIANSNTNDEKQKLISVYTILYFVNQFFTVHSYCTSTLKKYSKYSHVPEKQLLETLAFLKGLKISDEELEESLTIIFYPREHISRILKKIEDEAKTLEKCGFEKGCLPEETNLFKSGTKQKQKILQLCLYFLEKPFDYPKNGSQSVGRK